VNNTALKQPKWAIGYHYNKEFLAVFFDENHEIIERHIIDTTFKSALPGYNNPLPADKTKIYVGQIERRTGEDTYAIWWITDAVFGSAKRLRSAVRKIDRDNTWTKVLKLGLLNRELNDMIIDYVNQQAPSQALH
jgi:hypothetical protein